MMSGWGMMDQWGWTDDGGVQVRLGTQDGGTGLTI